jgi:hypothetical protein
MSLTIAFNDYWAAAESTSFLLAGALSATNTILWLLTYVENETMSYAFLVWNRIHHWHLLSSYWAAPALMIISQLTN